MHITIRVNQGKLNQEATLRMKRRLHLALGRFSNTIDRVSARLTVINGPTSEPDIQCVIYVILRKGGEIIIKGKGVDNDSALNYCADRISRAVDHELSRRWRAPIR